MDLIEKLACYLVLLQVYMLPVESKVFELLTLNTRLPSPRAFMPVTYDGEDSIYIWSGQYNGSFWLNDILKFSVSQETIEQIGSDCDIIERGSGVWAGNNTLLYVGGCTGPGMGGCYDDIWRIDPSNASYWSSIANLPKKFDKAATTWDGKDQTYVIGGFSSTYEWLSSIYTYSTSTKEVKEMASLPSGRLDHSAAFFNGNVYILGGRTSAFAGYIDEIVKHNPADNTTTLLNAHLPVKIGHGCAVSTPEYIYLIGGSTNAAIRWPAIVRFDPETEEVLPLQANNFPDKLHSTGCAFVKSQNRNYIFGGFVNGTFRDQIMYISLDVESQKR